MNLIAFMLLICRDVIRASQPVVASVMGFANTNIGWTLLGWMAGGVVMGITNCHNYDSSCGSHGSRTIGRSLFALVVVGVVLGITNSHIISAVL